MHRVSFRAKALLAILLAVSVTSMIAAAPRFEDGRDLDSAIRKTRSGPQRDAGDAIDHHVEIVDPVGVGIGDTPSTVDRHSRVHAPPGAAMLLPGPATPPGPDTLSSLYLVPPVTSPLLARPHTPSRGRAPPPT